MTKLKRSTATIENRVFVEIRLNYITTIKIYYKIKISMENGVLLRFEMKHYYCGGQTFIK